jgi:hypothetical protein
VEAEGGGEVALGGSLLKQGKNGEVGGGPVRIGGCSGVWAAGKSRKRAVVNEQGRAVGIW